MIIGDLEYVLASLPYLSFDDGKELRSRVSSIFRKYACPSNVEKSPVAILDEEAGKFLGTDSLEVFLKIDLDRIHTASFQKSKNDLLSGFSRYVYHLKGQLAQLRSARRNKEALSTSEKQKLPIRLGNPLEEELRLLKLQWNKLDTLSIGHYADFTALISYKLKLMLLQRWWSFDIERGFDLFIQASKKD